MYAQCYDFEERASLRWCSIAWTYVALNPFLECSESLCKLTVNPSRKTFDINFSFSIVLMFGMSDHRIIIPDTKRKASRSSLNSTRLLE